MAKAAAPAIAATNLPPTASKSAPLAGLKVAGVVPVGEPDGAEAVPTGVVVLLTGNGGGTKVGGGAIGVGVVTGVVVGMYGVIGTVGTITELVVVGVDEVLSVDAVADVEAVTPPEPAQGIVSM